MLTSTTRKLKAKVKFRLHSVMQSLRSEMFTSATVLLASLSSNKSETVTDLYDVKIDLKRCN